MAEVQNVRYEMLWSGIDEASNALRTIGHNASKELYPVIRRIIRPYRTPIRKEAPKGPTGNLRRGIKWNVGQRGVRVSSTAPHSYFVYKAIGRLGESQPYGDPNPYLHRAVGRYRGEITEGIAVQIEFWYEKAAAVKALG